MRKDERDKMVERNHPFVRSWHTIGDTGTPFHSPKTQILADIAYQLTRIADQGDSRPIPVTCSLFTIVKRIKEKLGDAEWGSDEHGAKMFNELIESEYDKLKETLRAHIHPAPRADALAKAVGELLEQLQTEYLGMDTSQEVEKVTIALAAYRKREAEDKADEDNMLSDPGEFPSMTSDGHDLRDEGAK